MLNFPENVAWFQAEVKNSNNTNWFGLIWDLGGTVLDRKR